VEVVEPIHVGEVAESVTDAAVHDRCSVIDFAEITEQAVTTCDAERGRISFACAPRHRARNVQAPVEPIGVVRTQDGLLERRKQGRAKRIAIGLLGAAPQLEIWGGQFGELVRPDEII
jgi:hypothetical protein